MSHTALARARRVLSARLAADVGVVRLPVDVIHVAAALQAHAAQVRPIKAVDVNTLEKAVNLPRPWRPLALAPSNLDLTVSIPAPARRHDAAEPAHDWILDINQRRRMKPLIQPPAEVRLRNRPPVRWGGHLFGLSWAVNALGSMRHTFRLPLRNRTLILRYPSPPW